MYVIVILFSYQQATAQDQPSLGFDGYGLEAVFLKVGEKYHVTFLYSSAVMTTGIKVTLSPKKRTLVEMLDALRKTTGLQYDIQGKTVHVSLPVPSPAQTPPAETDLLLRGMVQDQLGTSLPGVTIRNHNKGTGSVTGEKGEYSIRVSPGDQLSFSLIGYRTRQVTAGREMPSVILLEENIIDLSTTVVTGYTVKRVEELTGALSQLKKEDLTQGVTSADATSMIKGKVAGLYITEQLSANPAGGGGKMLMRGQSTLLGTQAVQVMTRNGNYYPITPNATFGPLIVVDGIISPYQEPKDAVNPMDIEELVVLKDAAATAIYGSRAAAGVIDITTRRGKREKIKIDVETKLGLNSPNRGKFRWMNARELYNARRAIFTEGWADNGTFWESVLGVSSLPDLLNKALPNEEMVAHAFDWSQYYYVRSRLQQINIAARGGNDKTRYYFSADHYYEQGTLRDNGLKRTSFRGNLDHDFNKMFSLQAGVSGLFDQETQPVVPPDLYEMPAWLSPYGENGELKPLLSPLISPVNYPPKQQPNFLFERQFNSKHYQQHSLWGNVKLTLRLTNWLTLSSNNAGNLMRGTGEFSADPRSFTGRTYSADNNGFLLTSVNNNNYFITSNTLIFERRLEKHWFRLLAGQEYQQVFNEKSGLNTEVLNLATGNIPYNVLLSNLGARELALVPEYNSSLTWEDIHGGRRKSRMFSLFSGGAYSYRSRYFISASLRNDASSEFGPRYRNATFWSAGASWVVNKEPFMQAWKAVNLLKLRANIGTSGSQLGNLFLTRTAYGPNSIIGIDGNNYNGAPGVYPFQVGNPQLAWETTRTLNIGMDVGVLDRIAVSLDYYRKRSFDLIQEVPQSAATGSLSPQFRNAGIIGNYGLELTLNTQNISARKFSWSTGFNIALNRNRIISVYGGALQADYGPEAGSGNNQAPKYYLYPGEDINTLKGVIYAGVDPATGKPLFEKPVRDGSGNIIKIEKVGSIEEALGPDGKGLQTLGTKTPRFSGGFSNTLKYGNFTLSVLAEFVYGTRSLNFEQQLFQADDGEPLGIGTTNRPAYTSFQHPWRYPGDKEANIPSVYVQTLDFADIRNSYFYENNSFLRIRNIRLDYRLPDRWLNRYIERAGIYISLDNLHTFTSKHFMQVDPEGAYVGGDRYSSLSGVGGGLGLPRRYMAGLRFSLK